MPDGAHSAAAEETQNLIATDLCVFARPKVRFFKVHQRRETGRRLSSVVAMMGGCLAHLSY